MALHPDFPDSPYAILGPALRWFPADEALRETSMDKLMPPLVATLRRKVEEFRDGGYVGATDTSRSLLNWWFKEPHLLPQADGTVAEFQYFFAQREALETIIYLYDVVGAKDKFDLMRFDSSGAVSAGMFDETWRRFVLKMATGTGKTNVMSLALTWSFFHKLYETDSELARNFLVIAPNIIVLDRIYHDFQGLRIFFEDPVLPDDGFDGRNWRDDFQLTLHKQDEVRVTQPTGNIFLTNIHRVYSGDDIPPSPDDDNTMENFFGKRPTGATTDSSVDLGMIVRDIDELMVLNDEAHHIHDARLEWFKSIEDIHNRLLQKGGSLALQVNVTATPKHNNGAIFVQTVSDYHSVIGYFAQTIMKELRLVSGYDVLFGRIKAFVQTELFDQTVDLEHPNTLRNLSELAATKTLIETFKKAINALTVRDKGDAEIRDTIKLRQTRTFVVKDQGYLIPKKSVFNRVIGDNHLELQFASFLEDCPDVVSYAKNYFVVHFKLDYANADGNISNYYPDFLVKLSDKKIVIVETKGLEDLNVPLKMARLRQWCEDINRVQSDVQYDLVYVDEESFETYKPLFFRQLMEGFREYKE